MKQACYRLPSVKRWGLAVFGIVLLFLVAMALSSCKQTPVADAPPTGPSPDRTVAGSGPGVVVSTPAETVYGRAVQKAIGDKCGENIHQLRLAIHMYMDEHGGTPPPSLGAVSGAELSVSCPVSHEPYTYDPATGRVDCPTHPSKHRGDDAPPAGAATPAAPATPAVPATPTVPTTGSTQ